MVVLYRLFYYVYIVFRFIFMMGFGLLFRGEVKVVRYSSNIINIGLVIGDVFKVLWLIL